ncbi:MAG: single-strand DNA-binding protein [Parcubacteria group bacterium Gr01-1014_20]|nr:MAG: single-strand DNA-binding protein [Parcubacteria group bacterium Gr01-1014_20]
MNLNKVILAGRLTAEPQLRTTPSGQSVASFSVATNRVWNDKNGARQEEVEFHNVVVWGKQAEIASQFMAKGALVLIEGRLRTRSWNDKQGSQRKTTEIICERFQLGPRAGQGGGVERRSGPNPVAPSESSHKDEPPIEEIPVIDIDGEIKDDIKPEDIPF